MPRFTSPLFDGRHTRSETAAASPVHYPRRFPRLGGQFQVPPRSIPALGAPLSDRPPPIRVVAPWLERLDASVGEDHDDDATMEPEAGPVEGTTAVAEPAQDASAGSEDPMSVDLSPTAPPPGARVAVTPPSVASMPLPLFMTIGGAHSAGESEEDPAAWVRRLLAWYNGGTTGAAEAAAAAPSKARGRGSRGSTNTAAANGNGKRPCPGGDDRPDLFGGGSDRKRLAVEQQNLLVTWSGGLAALSLRRRHRRAAAATRVQTLDFAVPASAAWRDHVLQYRPYLLGDYRAPVDDDDDEAAVDDAAPLPGFDHEMVWKAVLAYADGMYKDIMGFAATGSARGGGGAAGHPRVRLSHVCQLLYRAAHDLPPPEESCDAATCGAVNGALQSLVDVCRAAQKQQARLYDLFFSDGVDTDLLKKQLDVAGKDVQVEIDELEEWNHQLSVVTEWQARLDLAFKDEEDTKPQSDSPQAARKDMVAIEAFVEESKTHAFRSKGLAALEKRLEKAYQLRERILEWKKQQSDSPESMKFLGMLVRELSRLKLAFPEGEEVFELHRAVESWIDRATIAIRSRISLHEIQNLLERAREIPVNLSEFTDKLQSRVDVAEDWISCFKKELSCSEDETMSNLEWMQRVRQVLGDGVSAQLLDLASEASRLPVECDLAKIMQLEMDARTWTSMARKWIPRTGNDVDEPAIKRGKLDDLEEHVAKASALRERLCLSEDEKNMWVLDGEMEIRAIVDEAHDWFERYEDILEGDNRRNSDRSRLSIHQLREIVRQNDSVFANLGNATAKVTRILAQAEIWYEKYSPLLRRCGLLGDTGVDSSPVNLDELVAAVEAAESDLAVELDEAAKLRDMEERIRLWFEDFEFATGKTKKRSQRAKKYKFTIDRLKDLIDEAAILPVDTKDDVLQLREQLVLVQAWQARASVDLDAIQSGFKDLRQIINATFGLPAEYTRDVANVDDEMVEESVDTDQVAFVEEKKAADDSSRSDADSLGSDSEPEIFNTLSSAGLRECSVYILVKSFLQDASKTNLETPEGDVAKELQSVSQWCARSTKYLESQRDVFDKRFFGAFDRFIGEGKALLGLGQRNGSFDKEHPVNRLRAAWKEVVEDQMVRLDIILLDRSRFIDFCRNAEQLISGDKRIPYEKLKDMAEKSLCFPSVSEVIKNVRTLEKKSNIWKEEVKVMLSADEKPTFADAKFVLDAGEKLNITCDELKELRNGVKLARSWCNQVKRCKVENASLSSSEINQLLKEHDDLIVEMPEEVEKLSSAMCNYCICRRPYEGFMIACDVCEEWFHGPCIGVTESKAGKTEKYVCLRCLVVRTFQSSATATVCALKKWANDVDRKKARQVDAQKLQRKIRKDNKDLVALESEMKLIHERLEHITKVDDHSSPDAIMKEIEHVIDPMQIECTDAIAPAEPSAAIVVTSSEAEVSPSQEASTSQPPDSLTQLTEPVSTTSSVVEAITMPLQQQVEPSEEADSAAVLQGKPVSPLHQEGEPKAEEPNREMQATNKVDKIDSLSKEECEAKLEKIKGSIALLKSRLDDLAEKSAQRRNEQELEDANAAALKKWCLDVLALALMPAIPENVDASRFGGDGSMSKAMHSLIEEAERDGLTRFTDVKEVVNSFKCMAWCIRTSSILSRRPVDSEIESLVKLGSEITLPDDKAFRALKAIVHRFKAWNMKVKKALTPVPGEVKPFSVDALKDLSDMADHFPLTLPIQSRLITVIEDEGCRHCLCGGPSDGRFMLCCDKCNKWYHGICVGVKGMESEEWICPTCCGSTEAALDENVISNFHEMFTIEDATGVGEEDSADEDVSSKAPNVKEMWPPFGLLGSDKAKEALGSDFPAYNVLPDGRITVIKPTPAPAPRPTEKRPAVAKAANASVPVAAKPKAASAPKPQKPKPLVTSSMTKALTAAVKHAPPHLPPPFAFPAPLSNQLMQNMLAWQQSALLPLAMRAVAPPPAPSGVVDQLGLSNLAASLPRPAAGAVDPLTAVAAAMPLTLATPALPASSGSLSLDLLKKGIHHNSTSTVAVAAAPVSSVSSVNDASEKGGQ